MNKHTPGPWLTVRDNSISLPPFDLRIVWSEKHGDICYVQDDDGDNGNSNARLIAAAPELLEALRGLLLLHQSHPGQLEPLAVEEARAAIAKAEGREA